MFRAISYAISALALSALIFAGNVIGSDAFWATAKVEFLLACVAFVAAWMISTTNLLREIRDRLPAPPVPNIAAAARSRESEPAPTISAPSAAA